MRLEGLSPFTPPPLPLNLILLFPPPPLRASCAIYPALALQDTRLRYETDCFNLLFYSYAMTSLLLGLPTLALNPHTHAHAHAQRRARARARTRTRAPPLSNSASRYARASQAPLPLPSTYRRWQAADALMLPRTRSATTSFSCPPLALPASLISSTSFHPLTPFPPQTAPSASTCSTAPRLPCFHSQRQEAGKSADFQKGVPGFVL